MNEAFARIQWSSTPPDTSGERFYPLIRPTVHSPCYGLTISQTITCVETHWLDNGTRPCLGGVQHCEGCRFQPVTRTKAYVAVINRSSGKIGIMEFTGEAIRHCPRLQGEDRVVRGCRLKAFRRGSYSNSPVGVEIVDEIAPDQVPVLDFDIRPHLGRIWGMLPTKGMHKGNANRDRRRKERGDA